MTDGVAIVGMGCRYPDATCPTELWENVLAARRAFRCIPAQRLRLEDYYAADRSAPDRTYAKHAAVLTDYEFDRARFRVVGSTFQSADLTHWLALDVAAQALADAGWPDAVGMPKETTAVIVGNTLTGEFSRASILRLRWPFVRRMVDAALMEEQWPHERRVEWLDRLERRYKAPFPPVNEETLAGSLSNTIAGRICNHFDLKGGGYTVDGACASSLLAVATACGALVNEEVDVALAGGVDLSLDPFELVGFAKAGALAPDMMRVYDARSNGFWPGEGCGFVTLVRLADAVADGRRIYGVIKGWGVSSDGSGGITRPEREGQLLALRRAYLRAGFGIDTVAYFEGHGTGTPVGDATELQALSVARREVSASSASSRAAVGSIKANIGHTKAAAGVAGLIKATLAMHEQLIPPTTGCEEPHPELRARDAVLEAPSEGRVWPAGAPVRVGVSAMGFGGINTHVVLEGASAPRREAFDARERRLLASPQSTELFLLAAESAEELARRADSLAERAAVASFAELADLAAMLASSSTGPTTRAAVVACSPTELVQRLTTVAAALRAGERSRIDAHAGVYFGTSTAVPRIGFLFTGQGSPPPSSGGFLERRFPVVSALPGQWLPLPCDVASGDPVETALAQPQIVRASLAGLRVLEALFISADVGVGHSLGELTALYWAGVLDADAVYRIARGRGRAMAACDGPAGAMASIGAGASEIRELVSDARVVIAGINGPRQTVVSGEAPLVLAVIARARALGIAATQLPVSHAFHSPLVAAAVPALRELLDREVLRVPQRSMISTVTGGPLGTDTDVRDLLCAQITSAVRFADAVRSTSHDVALWIEVGPGRVLQSLAAELTSAPVLSLDVGAESAQPACDVLAAAYVLGVPVLAQAFFEHRFVRPFALDRLPVFLTNPCELAPKPSAESDVERPVAAPVSQMLNETLPAPPAARGTGEQALDVVRRLVAARADLPLDVVRGDDRLLADLHLNSISVGELVAQAARALSIEPSAVPTEYANATVAEVAEALDTMLATGAATSPSPRRGRFPEGVDSWVRSFVVELVERACPPRSNPDPGLIAPPGWNVIAPLDHPLVEPLRARFSEDGSGLGTVVCLPPEPDERALPLLIEAARVSVEMPRDAPLVFVQHGWGAAAFARSVHLERSRSVTCVVDVPVHHPDAAAWIVQEAFAARGFSEARYDAAGRRFEPVLRYREVDDRDLSGVLSANDVLLVTGGGKGIAAECALDLARASGASLVLLGRSAPDADAELSANLDRMVAAGVRVRYCVADVTDGAAVQRAVAQAEATVGPITGVLHGAGVNAPRPLHLLDVELFRRTLAPKVQGARNVLASLDSSRLRLFVAFGSVIARTGLPGEAHYGLANEWLERFTEDLQRRLPKCRCRVLEWSVWSGVGMGERLGRVEALTRHGITPIGVDEGVAVLRRLVADPNAPVSVVVAGRMGEPPTITMADTELPLLRFLETPRVYYPGVELIADADVTRETDPYLDDHTLQGERIFPAVMGLEAMAQVAQQLAPSRRLDAFERVEFTRPIVLGADGRMTLRVAALARAPGEVDVVIRSSLTDYRADHMRATCRFVSLASDATLGHAAGSLFSQLVDTVPIPADDLYETVLFQRGRFRRLVAYHRLTATGCLAKIATSGGRSWFGEYLPDTLLLGDPGARDAALHAVQGCVPHATLLPTGAARVILGATQECGESVLAAREIAHEGDLFEYEINVERDDGLQRERWEGLRFQIVGGSNGSGRSAPGRWIAPLLGPYLERRLGELVPGSKVSVVVEHGPDTGPRERGERALRRLISAEYRIVRRPDGKREVLGDLARRVSLAHAGELTLAVVGEELLGCDMEPVTPRSLAAWEALLGPDRLTLGEMIQRETGESLDGAATRVWAGLECLRKAGKASVSPLVYQLRSDDGWVLLCSGESVIATTCIEIASLGEPIVFAVLARIAGWSPESVSGWPNESRVAAASLAADGG